MDILNQVQTVFKAALADLKYTSPIKNVERIPDVKAISIKYGFPAVGVLDGGEDSEFGASVSLITHAILLAVYVNVLGDQETCMEEVRAIVDKCIDVLRRKEHYRSGGAFEGFSRAWCRKKSEIKQVFNADDHSPLLMKLARIDFKRQEVTS